jgi:hypothetical protein
MVRAFCKHFFAMQSVIVDATSINTDTIFLYFLFRICADANSICVDALPSAWMWFFFLNKYFFLRLRRKFIVWSIYLFIFYMRMLQCLEVTDAGGAIVLILIRPSAWQPCRRPLVIGLLATSGWGPIAWLRLGPDCWSAGQGWPATSGCLLAMVLC